ncbi:RhoGAP domain-containing protein [Hamiltosporidium tvaerminnensis]|uniref:RhoGAP domain-containing protein n=1 Tax=Hamiltosporidium tvaerminnensis TaxID=1176355 RepID=A0A4Q9LH29_9MICR|nr:RhoGAP domain-containing protein [Hamiltosporidium tvaerminnensis]
MERRKIRKKLLQPRIESINDLNKDLYRKYILDYIDNHYTLISRYYSVISITIIRNDLDFLEKLIYNTEFKRTNCSYLRCNIKYGQRDVKIPMEFKILMDAILKRDLRQEGLFRKVPVYTDLKMARDDYIGGVLAGENIRYLRNVLKKFDVICLTSLFKELFNLYNTPVFPEKYLKLLLVIAKMKDHSMENRNISYSNEKEICEEKLDKEILCAETGTFQTDESDATDKDLLEDIGQTSETSILEYTQSTTTDSYFESIPVDIRMKLIMKFTILSLPRQNRRFLEVLIKFFSVVHNLSIKGDKMHKKNMTLRGYSVVIMPKLFLKTKHSLDITEINELVDLSEYILFNSPSFFDIKDNPTY